MKLWSKYTFTALFLASVFALSGCLLENSGKGTIIINLGGGNSRSVYDWPPTDEMLRELAFVIKLTGNGGKETFTANGTDKTIRCSVISGHWNIEINAYFGETHYATGSNSLNVIAGHNNTVAIQMKKTQKMQTISMTVETEWEFPLLICGTGKITIDWGDGKVESRNLISIIDYGDYWYLFPDESLFLHSYNDSTARIITITGANIMDLSIHQFFSELDLSNSNTLETLWCDGDDSTDIGKQLKELDVSNHTAMKGLACRNNLLTELDLSNNHLLWWLFCSSNQLTELDLSSNPVLGWLECNDNQITKINLYNNILLEYLYCYNNQLTELDVSNNSMLTSLNCSGNQLTELDVSYNSMLTYLNCSGNNLNATALNNLFNSLRNNGGMISIGDNPGTDTCDRSIAENKGWHFMYY